MAADKLSDDCSPVGHSLLESVQLSGLRNGDLGTGIKYQRTDNKDNCERKGYRYCITNLGIHVRPFPFPIPARNDENTAKKGAQVHA